MKATIRILAVLLVAIMMIGIFAGCQQQTNPTTKPADKPTGGNDGTTGEKVLEPKTISIMVNANGYDDFDFQRFVDGETNIYPWFMEKCKEFNLTVEWILVESDQYDTAVQTTLADPDTMPDMMYLGNKEALALQAAEAGIILDMQTVLEYSNGTASAWFEANPHYFARSQYMGKNWWHGSYQDVTWQGEIVPLGGGCPTGPQLREDWINALIAKGYTKYEDVANWPDTLEEMGQFIQDCQDADVNGNELKDECLFAYFDKPGRATGIEKYFGVPQHEFAPDFISGELVTFWEAEGVKDYFKAILDFTAKGYIPADIVGVKASSTKFLSNNKVAVYDTYFCNSWSLKQEYVPEGAETPKFSGMMMDTTVHPLGYLGRDAAPTMDNNITVFSANADPEACCRILDMIISREWNDMILYGTEGDSYFINNKGEKVMVESEDIQSAVVSTNACIGRGVFSFGVFQQIGQYAYAPEEDAAYAQAISDNAYTQFSAAMPCTPTIPNQINAFLSVTTEDEAAVINELEGDYLTTSAELYVKIVTGVLDVDKDWDTIMGELKSAGYEEIKAVYEARWERFKEANG